MHSFWMIVGLVFVCILIRDGAAQTPERLRYRADELARASSSFGFNLYRRLASRDDNNIIISPFSVFAALSMTLLGTDSRTKRQLRTVLAQRERQGIHHTLNDYLNSIPSDPRANVTLRVANAVYYDDRRVTLVNEFRDNMDRLYGASPRRLERPDPEQPINEWVRRSTGGKIRDFLNPGDITSDMVILLLNAVFFQGTWRDIFDERLTRQQDFITASGRVMPVPMMTRDGDYSVKSLRNLRASVLELPFGTDGRFSLFIVLPAQANGLPDLEARLTSETLEEALSNMPQARRFMISVPKFTLRVKTSMKKVLQSLGLTDIFSDQADLSRMATGGRLKVDDVKHEAVIEVDEKGATAAAVTAVGVVAVSLPPTFTAEHPFMVILRDNNARLNLFMGRLNDPSPQQ